MLLAAGLGTVPPVVLTRGLGAPGAATTAAVVLEAVGVGGAGASDAVAVASAVVVGALAAAEPAVVVTGWSLADVRTPCAGSPRVRTNQVVQTLSIGNKTDPQHG